MYDINSMQQMLPQALQSYANYSNPSLDSRRMGRKMNSMRNGAGLPPGLLEAIASGGGMPLTPGGGGGMGGGIPGLGGGAGGVPDMGTIGNDVSNPQGLPVRPNLPPPRIPPRMPPPPRIPDNVMGGLTNRVSAPQGLTKRVSNPQGGR